MLKSLLFLCAGLLGGLALSALWPSEDPVRGIDPHELVRMTDDARIDRMTDDARAIAELQQTFTEQIGALERKVAALRSDYEQLSAETSARLEQVVAARDRNTPTPTGPAGNFAVADLRRRTTPEGRIEALTDAGFSLGRAQQIERRIQEMQVDAMRARYEAAQQEESGEAVAAPIDVSLDTLAMLRAELGDIDYERYLEAMQQPTRAMVESVLASSAAEQAGMQSGDVIVAYDGRRIFSPRELAQMSLQGEPDELVMVDVLRPDSGQQLQLVLPRGPLGISATGSFNERE